MTPEYATGQRYTLNPHSPGRPVIRRGGWADGSEDENLDHQRDACNGKEAAGKALKDAHGRCLRYRACPGEEACGDCCSHTQFYYAHSQVQHLHVEMCKTIDEAFAAGAVPSFSGILDRALSYKGRFGYTVLAL